MLVIKLTERVFFNAIKIQLLYPKLLKYDALALAIAKENSFILLTGDKALRIAAKEEGVEVRGTLWVFDELLSEGVVSKEKYVYFMLELKKHNGKEIRLPVDEIENKRISRLK